MKSVSDLAFAGVGCFGLVVIAICGFAGLGLAVGIGWRVCLWAIGGGW